MNEVPRLLVFLAVALFIHLFIIFVFNGPTLNTTFAKGKTSHFSQNIEAANQQNVYVVSSAATNRLAIALQESKIKVNQGSEIEKTETETTTTALNHVYEVIDESKDVIEESMGVAANDASIDSASEHRIDDNHRDFIENPAPEYPYHDMVLNNQGTVTVTLSINKAGDVIHAKLEKSSGFETLDYKALVAVKKWKYNIKLASKLASYPIKKTIKVDFKIDE